MELVGEVMYFRGVFWAVLPREPDSLVVHEKFSMDE